MASEISRCPGCGLLLPVSDWPIGRRVNASAACWRLYTTVAEHESAHIPQLGRFHQLTVDAYGAQHAGSPTPPIGTAFGLLGLHLALDHGWSGTAVRAAHGWLAQRHRSWPTFEPPSNRGKLTVRGVAEAETPEAHAERVQAWAASVWSAWADQHHAVAAWTDAVLPTADRERLRLA
jgi:hypothetical protein